MFVLMGIGMGCEMRCGTVEKVEREVWSGCCGIRVANLFSLLPTYRMFLPHVAMPCYAMPREATPYI